MELVRPVFALGVLMFCGIAVAGEKYDPEVVIDHANRSAMGSLPGTRHSLDSSQHLSCTLQAYPTGLIGSCTARHPQFAAVTCQTTNQFLLEAIKSLTDSSYIHFTWDSTGTCTYIGVSNLSTVGPKK